MQQKIHKYLIYIILALVLVASFLLANLLIQLISIGKISTNSIVFVLINIILNFVMLLFLFKFSEQLEEKKQIIAQLQDQINELQKPTKADTEEKEEKAVNIDEIVQQLIPASLQNITITQLFEKVLANFGKVYQLACGIAYIKDSEGFFQPTGKYAYYSTEPIEPFKEGEGLTGQVVKDKRSIYIQQVPPNYMRIVSGLGQSSPRYLYIFPILNTKDEVIAVMELASFTAFDDSMQQIINKLSVLLSKIIVKIK